MLSKNDVTQELRWYVYTDVLIPVLQIILVLNIRKLPKEEFSVKKFYLVVAHTNEIFSA